MAEPELDDPPTVLFAGGAGSTSESVQGRDARLSFVPIFGAAAVTGSAETIPVAHNTAYSLRGLFETVDGRGLAMIESSGVTAVYRERDRLPGGETIARLDSDGVMIDGGRGLALIAFEDLSVTEAEPGERPASATREPKAEIANAATTTVEAERRPPLSQVTLTEQVLSTDALLSAARFRRVRARSGGIGLQIQWLRRDDLTDAIGLHRGDVILSVNGLSVDDPKAMDALSRTLPESREVVIDLERRDEPHRLVIPLSHG